MPGVTDHEAAPPRRTRADVLPPRPTAPRARLRRNIDSASVRISWAPRTTKRPQSFRANVHGTCADDRSASVPERPRSWPGHLLGRAARIGGMPDGRPPRPLAQRRGGQGRSDPAARRAGTRPAPPRLPLQSQGRPDRNRDRDLFPRAPSVRACASRSSPETDAALPPVSDTRDAHGEHRSCDARAIT